MRRFCREGFTKTFLYRQDYVGSLEYRFTTANGLQPEAAYFGDGRVAFIENYRRYEYYLKDHLGNIRLTFTDKNNNGVVDVNNTANNEILQENHYYPFGMDQSGPWMNDAALDNAYKYNGKELNTDFGLQWMDYGARWYDGALGRWFSVDPLVEMTFSEGSYTYSGCSPISYIDVGGLFKLNPKGKYPQLERYFESNDFLRILNNPDLRNGLKTLGGFTDDQITDMGRNGFGPEIYILPRAEMGAEGNSEVNGHFLSRDGDGSFAITAELVNQFEQASPENKQAALLLIVMTIFHEAVHVGINKNNPPLQSIHGNWERRGDIYFYKNLPTGFKEGSDINALSKMKKYEPYARSMTSEDGNALEHRIWFNEATKRGISKEAKEFSQNPDKAPVVPIVPRA